MKMQGIEFGPCWDGPGVRGFFGEGWWYHHLPLMRQWLKMEGSTFVSKTTTIPSRIPPNGGNMPISAEYPWAPKEWVPRCIWVDMVSGRTVNGVGLSGPGAEALFFRGLLDERPDGKPFLLSFMSVAKTPEARLAEFKQYARLLLHHLMPSRKLKLGLQVNFSCPNTGLDPAHLISEATATLDAAESLVEAGIPIVPKLNVLAPIEAVVKIAAHTNCDALCVSNTLPFGMLPDWIPWKDLFPRGSPVQRRDVAYGMGGYSGPELLQLVAYFIQQAQAMGVTKPWNAGGGIRSVKDVEYLVSMARLRRGRDSIFFASAAITRPWNVPGIIEAAHHWLA